MTQAHMAMAGMGGPVGGGPVGQQMNAGTPNSASAMATPDVMIKKLNTAIYEYLLCIEKYDAARALIKANIPIEMSDIKQSPGQRGHHANGIDSGADGDNKEHVGIKSRPDDLPAPLSLHNEGSSFLQDWWFQFWETWSGQRHNGRPTVLQYIGNHRQAQKSRQTAVMQAAAEMQALRYGANPMMNAADLRQAAIKKGAGMTPTAMQQLRVLQQQQQQQQQHQAQHPGQMQATQMERQGSQMDMAGARNGSPHSGDAPSPKRPKLSDNNMAQLNQARAQAGQMAINQVMPQNAGMAHGGPQSSPMSQPGMADGTPNDFYNNNANRMAMAQNGAVAAAQQGAAAGNGGNHALQDYQMQLMLLEQQNKKRLLMARQEQDSMSNQGGIPGANGGRGSPTPAMMDPAMNGNMRMVMGPNGQPLRPPSSHPIGQPMTPQQAQQMEILRQNGMMPNGNWPGGQPQPGQMMPGQQPGQPPNMTPRSMPPPPAPQNGVAGGTQPSSPAQPPAPPTPNAAAKAKPATKKETKASKAAAKKGGAAAAANEENAASNSTPPPPPVTPSAANSFAQNKNMAMANGQGNQAGQNNQNNQQSNGAVQAPSDMGVGFPDLNGEQPFSNMTSIEFADLGSTDVLETFDFDSFLNSGGDELSGFDAGIMFGDGPIEADGIGN